AVDLGRGVPLRIMVPMVVGADEVRTVRAAVDEVVAALGVPPVQVGAMVETVAAVESIDELCGAADFLSIGTNDLTAQVLDLDRTDPRARPELTAHPSVLELVGRVVAARGRGRDRRVCPSTDRGGPMVGIVLISHSSGLAEGAAELVGQIAAGTRVVPAGGTDDGRLGTSTDRIAAAIAAADTGDGV